MADRKAVIQAASNKARAANVGLDYVLYALIAKDLEAAGLDPDLRWRELDADEGRDG